MIDGVKNFLENLGMLKYHDIFCAKGFDLESDIPHLNLSDLEESLMIESYADRALIYASAKNFKPSVEYTLFDWLHQHSLDHYYINFIQSELTDLKTLAQIQLPNEDLYDELEMVLPGHKKRFERAVASLRGEGCERQPAETPVTQGWWGKPDCLPQAKFDFLCVTANLFAFHEPDNKASIDFMVDSGSDVSTVQEKTLESLNLELIGPIYSCGIHGGNYTNLYKAVLEVGGEHLVIEVMASNYDSLGSRIVRHFRHIIDGSKHIWLRGNYKDPVPAILPLPLPAKSSNHTSIHPSSYEDDILPRSSLLPLPPCTPSPLSIQNFDQSSSPNEVSHTTNDEVSGFDKKSQVRIKDSESSENILTHRPGADRLSREDDVNLKKTSTSPEYIPSTSCLTNQVARTYIDPEVTATIFCVDEPRTASSIDSTIKDSLLNTVTNSHCENEPQSECANVKKFKSSASSRISHQDLEADKFKIDSAIQNRIIQNGVDPYERPNNSSKSLCYKRPNPVSLTNISSPSPIKVCKVKLEENSSSLKDTDDDIDNVNPFLSSVKHLGQHGESNSISGVAVHPEDIMKTSSESDVTFSRVNAQDEVVHVLNESKEEEAVLVEDLKEDEEGLEPLQQNKNFMPGLGMSVMIALDDLENRDSLP